MKVLNKYLFDEVVGGGKCVCLFPNFISYESYGIDLDYLTQKEYECRRICCKNNRNAGVYYKFNSDVVHKCSKNQVDFFAPYYERLLSILGSAF